MGLPLDGTPHDPAGSRGNPLTAIPIPGSSVPATLAAAQDYARRLELKWHADTATILRLERERALLVRVAEAGRKVLNSLHGRPPTPEELALADAVLAWEASR